MKHRFIILLFAVIANIGTNFAESGTCGENLTWDLTDSVLTISGTGAMTNYSYDSHSPWYGNEYIRKVELSNGVTSIGDYAFHFCSYMSSIEIPNSVTSIGTRAFSNCTGLTSITCKAVNPPAVGNNVFYYINKKSTPLYVPAESIAAYKAADQWKEFYNILAIEEANEVVYDTKHSSKLIRNGSVYILTDDSRTYTLTGQEVR